MGIERRHLVGRIKDARDANLVLLVAPAGYGKTTLAQQLLAHRPAARKAWYHLDEYDSNPSRFLSYLVAALKETLPKIDTANRVSGVTAVVEDICFALGQFRGPECWLVLDNWECVDANPDIAGIPPALARSANGRLKVVITSRVPPSFKTRREQASGSIIRIGAADLAFSLPECQEAMETRLGRKVDEESVAQFWKETSGWCVCLGLLPGTSDMAGQVPSYRPVLSPTRSGVVEDYLREELYDRLPTAFVTFLSEISLYDELTVERCAAVVSDTGRIEEYLAQLERSAIPHVALEQKGHYRLHALVRQAFRSLLGRVTPPDRLPVLYRCAADQYLKEGMVLEAVDLFMEFGDYDAALKLMDTRWSDLFGKHGWTRVRQWLERLPIEYHDRPAYIKTYSNVLNVSGDNQAAMQFLRDKLSIERFRDDVESFGSLWANYWWARINTESAPHYDAALAARDDLIATTSGFSPTMLGIFENTLGVAAHLELRLQEAIRHIRCAAQLIEEPYPRLRMVASQNEALYTHLLGNSIAALELLRHVGDECRRLGLHAQTPKIKMLEASIQLAMGRYRETLRTVDECIESMRESGNYSLQMNAYLGRFRGVALWYLGDRTEGLQLLQLAQEPAREFSRNTGVEVELLYEYFTLLSEQTGEAVDTRHLTREVGPSECRLISLVLQSTRALIRNEHSLLKRHAGSLYDLACQHSLRPWIVTGSFLVAASFYRSQDRERQREMLESGLKLMQQLGWHTYPMANDLLTAFVMVRAIRLGLNTDLAELLRSDDWQVDLTPAFRAELADKKLTEDERIRLWEAASRLAIRGLSEQLESHLDTAGRRELPVLHKYREFLDESPPPPLHVIMLGSFSVTSGGRSARFTRSRSRLLLQHLLVKYPGAMHEEELMEYLWPESDPDKSRLNLRTTVKDLRKDLDPYAEPRGKTYITYRDQHYGLDLPAGSYIDYRHFTAQVEQFIQRDTSALPSLTEHISRLLRATAIYRGPLLPNLPYDSFAIELREHLQSLFQLASQKLAEMLIAGNRHDEAVPVIERALAFDSLWTEGVKMLMQLSVKRGDILKAMRAYRRYEKELQEELSLPPDESIREFFSELMKPVTP